MKDSSKIIELEIATPKQSNVYFQPFGQPLRGRKDFMEIARHQPEAVQLASEFPRGIPGTRVRIDLEENTVTLIEPLQSDEWTDEREKILRRNIPVPQTIYVESPHLPDWLWEVKRTLDYGYAEVLSGSLPEELGVERDEDLQESARKNEQVDLLCDVVKQLAASQMQMQTEMLKIQKDIAKALASK